MDEQIGETYVTPEPTFNDVNEARGNSNIWNELEHAAMSQMTELTGAIQELAPEPGSLVYVEAKRLLCNSNGWDPILFSAIDVCTHLQIARIYLTPTQASAIDFLQFIVQHYPFALKQVRTTADPEFINKISLESGHQFITEARKLDIFHTIVLDESHHPVLRVLSKYLFCGTLEGTLSGTSEEQVVTALVDFLLFSNNFRSLATIGGLTPLQKLNECEGKNKMTLFNPYQPTLRRTEANRLR